MITLFLSKYFSDSHTIPLLKKSQFQCTKIRKHGPANWLLLGIRSFGCRAQCPSRHFKIMSICCGTWGSRMRAAKCTLLTLSIFHQQNSTLILEVCSSVPAGWWSRYSRPIDWRVCNLWRRTRFSPSLFVSSKVWRINFFFLLFWVSRVGWCWFPFFSPVIFDRSSTSFNCRNIGSGRMFRIFSCLRQLSVLFLVIHLTTFFWKFSSKWRSALDTKTHTKPYNSTGKMRDLYSPSFTSVCTFTATFLRRRYSTLWAFLNRSSMCIFQLRLSETWMSKSFTVFELSSFWSKMLKLRSLPLKVIFVHLPMASSILFLLTHSSTLSMSSCISQYDFLIESTLKSSAKVNGSKKARTSGRLFINMQNSTGPRSEHWGTPLVTSRVLEIQFSFPTNCSRFSR